MIDMALDPPRNRCQVCVPGVDSFMGMTIHTGTCEGGFDLFRRLGQGELCFGFHHRWIGLVDPPELHDDEGSDDDAEDYSFDHGVRFGCKNKKNEFPELITAMQEGNYG